MHCIYEVRTSRHCWKNSVCSLAIFQQHPLNYLIQPRPTHSILFFWGEIRNIQRILFSVTISENMSPRKITKWVLIKKLFLNIIIEYVRKKYGLVSMCYFKRLIHAAVLIGEETIGIFSLQDIWEKMGMRRSLSNQEDKRQWRCPQALACVWVHIRWKGGLWASHKILFRAEECRRFLSTLRSMRWAPDKGGAGGRPCPERLRKWAGGGGGVERWSPRGAQLNSHLHVRPPPHHRQMGPDLEAFEIRLDLDRSQYWSRIIFSPGFADCWICTYFSYQSLIYYSYAKF